MKSLIDRRRSVGAGLALAAACLLAPGAFGQAATSGSARILGKVQAADGKTPVRGASVLAYHLSSERVFTSSPTSAKGEFEIAELPYGYFDVAVDAADGQFVGNQVVNVPPDGKVAVVFTLVPLGSEEDAASARRFPGTREESAGVARVQEKLAGRDFWRSPKGVAILAGGGGVVLLAIAAGDDNDASAFLP